jgi:uncharacterized iron-regulated membrane protein
MRRYARWHIWLGWLIGVPLLLWTASGVVMVLKPIEEVRGNDLRIERPEQAIATPPSPIALPAGSPDGPIESRTFVQRGTPVTLLSFADGRVERYSAATGRPIPPMDEAEARAALSSDIRGGGAVTSMRAFTAGAPPLDLRKPIDVWQATLPDGAHVYLNRHTGEIEAVRTRWWRFYDFMWGLHIMDLRTREDAHNPFTIAFGILAFLGTLMGFVLLFRRRKARAAAR